MVHANICVRDMERSVPFYEMLGFEKFADQIFGEGAGVWRGLGLEGGRRFRAVFMKIPGDHAVPFLDIIQFLDPPTAGEPYPTLHNAGIARLCFEVDDIHAAVAHLKANGVEFVGPLSPYETAKGIRPEGRGRPVRLLQGPRWDGARVRSIRGNCRRCAESAHS
jgi:catechol 2,3-dioxygenase-like lactoylglutathione lyase family enzyme